MILLKQSTFLDDPARMNTPWFESTVFERILERSALDDEQKVIVKAVAQNGFDRMNPEIDSFDESARRIIESLTPLLEHEGRVQDAWRFNDDVKAIATAPAVLNRLRLLYGREPIPFQTLNFRVGTEQRTHSDTIHFHSVPQRFMCGVWVALEDVDDTNGPLHYYPGSHKLPIYDMQDLDLVATAPDGGYRYYGAYEDFVEEMMAATAMERINAVMPKGEAMVWTANLFHGGTPITDPARTRWSQVTHYYFDECCYYTPMDSDPMLGRIRYREIEDIRTGKVVPNRYHGETIEVPSLEMGTPKTTIESLRRVLTDSTTLRRGQRVVDDLRSRVRSGKALHD